MPAPLDLTGRVFGRLTVLRAGPTVQFGGPCRSWVCRCECGAEIVVPQKRLPYARWIVAIRGRAIDGCPTCSGHPCRVCGAILLRSQSARTCPGACRDASRKARQRASWRKCCERDPGLSARMHARQRERAAVDPDYAARLLEWSRRQTARRSARLRSDPEYAERIRRQHRETYARHAGRIQAERRARLDALTPAERDEWRRQARKYCRDWQRRHRASLHADPEAYQRYRQIYNEYKRLRRTERRGPQQRTCAICGHQWDDRKYKTVCDKPECRAEYARHKTRESRGRSLFRTLERKLMRLYATTATTEDAGRSERPGPHLHPRHARPPR